MTGQHRPAHYPWAAKGRLLLQQFKKRGVGRASELIARDCAVVGETLACARAVSGYVGAHGVTTQGFNKRELHVDADGK